MGYSFSRLRVTIIPQANNMILPLLSLFGVAYADIICPIIVGGSEVLPDDRYDYHATYVINVWLNNSPFVQVIGCDNGPVESAAIELAKQDAYNKLGEAFFRREIMVDDSHCEERKQHAYPDNTTALNITGVMATCTIVGFHSTESVVVKNTEPSPTKSPYNYQLIIEDYEDHTITYNSLTAEPVQKAQEEYKYPYETKQRRGYNTESLAISIPLIIGGEICGGIAFINKERRDNAAKEYDALYNDGIESDWVLSEKTKKQQNALLISGTMLGATGLAVMIAGAF